MEGSELADIKAAIMDQWRSMAGMGAMFVSSILFGVFIQPFYNFEEMRAFGEEGTTEAGNCLLYTSPSPRDGLLSRMPSSA